MSEFPQFCLHSTNGGRLSKSDAQVSSRARAISRALGPTNKAGALWAMSNLLLIRSLSVPVLCA